MSSLSISDPTSVYVDVALPLAHRSVFTYRLPKRLTEENRIGSRVIVPFQHRLAIGVIVAKAGLPKSGNVREVCLFLDKKPLLAKAYLDLLKWMGTYYLAPLGTVLQRFLKPFLSIEQMRFCLEKNPKNRSSAYEQLSVHWPNSREISYAALSHLMASSNLFTAVSTVLQQGSCTVKDTALEAKERCFSVNAEKERFTTVLQKKIWEIYERDGRGKRGVWVAERFFQEAGVRSAMLSRLFNEGLLKMKELPAPLFPKKDPVLSLTEEETQLLSAGPRKPDLMNKVTFLSGSEFKDHLLLYKAWAKATIQEGKILLLLVPNLADLTLWAPSLKALLQDRLVVWSAEQKAPASCYARVRSGAPLVVLGTPSALFLPFQKLDHIVVTQEGSPDYRQAKRVPHYHARNTAVMYGRLWSIPVDLVGNTPSLATYHNIQKGKYLQSSLTVNNRPPAVQIMTRARYHPIITQPLLKKIAAYVAEKKQVVFLYPRRGYGGSTSCPNCGWQATCSTCHTGLVYHQGEEVMRCHPCRKSVPIPEACPRCQSTQLRYQRVGIQQVEEELKSHLPQVAMARVDSDTASNRRLLRSYMERFQEGRCDLLIGTQRLLRLLPHLAPSLVVIVDIHCWTDAASFYAVEEQCLLLDFLRYGAHARELVLVGTKRRYSAMAALTKDYRVLYKELLSQRKQHGYPPFAQLLRVHLHHPDIDLLHRIGEDLVVQIEQGSAAQKMGVVPSLTNQGAQLSIWLRLTDRKDKERVHVQVRAALHQKRIRVSFDIE